VERASSILLAAILRILAATSIHEYVERSSHVLSCITRGKHVAICEGHMFLRRRRRFLEFQKQNKRLCTFVIYRIMYVASQAEVHEGNYNQTVINLLVNLSLREMQQMVKEKTEPRILKFSCNCIDSTDDPWSYVSQSGVLSSETRQIIINKIYKEPKTVTQLAKEIGLSQPAIHKHVADLLKESLIKEVEVPESERAFKREKYYAPNFPVILKSDLDILGPILKTIVKGVVKVIKENENRLEKGFSKTSLPKKQWAFEDLTFFLYRKITDLTREEFEREGFFPKIPVRNGEKWVFWTEEVNLEEG